MNKFLQDHFQRNNIITTEQAGGKKEVLGCLEQLLKYKIILEEITENCHSLITMWLDYQNAFDRIPHKWLIKVGELR